MWASASEIMIVFAIKFMISTFLFINYTLLLFSHPSPSKCYYTRSKVQQPCHWQLHVSKSQNFYFLMSFI